MIFIVIAEADVQITNVVMAYCFSSLHIHYLGNAIEQICDVFKDSF